jgi:hypothetical protein
VVFWLLPIFIGKMRTMKYFLSFLFLIILASACKPKVLSGAKLEKKLIETMQDHLDKTAKPGVSYMVQDVTFYTEKAAEQYICEFHVHMHADRVDTTGIMTAIIPNDFSRVERKQ